MKPLKISLSISQNSRRIHLINVNRFVLKKIHRVNEYRLYYIVIKMFSALRYFEHFYKKQCAACFESIESVIRCPLVQMHRSIHVQIERHHPRRPSKLVSAH